MFETLETNALNRISTIREMIELHSREAIIQNSTSTSIKEYSLASTITRLYAVFENLVESLISDYLDAISELIPYEQLPEKFRKEYRLGVSIILGKLDHERYAHLSLENIVNWYHDAISNKQPYKIITQALTRHDENLRMSALNEMFGKINLLQLTVWLCKHPRIKQYYSGNSPTEEQLANELKDLVQLRNDAAHGSLDNLEGEDELIKRCDFIEAILISICSFVRNELLLKLEDANQLIIIGTVTEVFNRSQAFILTLNKGVTLKILKPIYFRDGSDCYMQAVNSIKLDNQSFNSVLAKIDKIEVGLKCQRLAKEKTQLIQIR